MVSTFGLTNLNNFSRLWGVGAVPGCLALALGCWGSGEIVAQSESLLVVAVESLSRV